MKQVEICKGQEEQSGMKHIHYHLYGNSMSQVKFLTDLTGTIGVLSKKFHGKIIFNYG